MQNRTRTLAALAVAAATLSVAGPAHADPSRGEVGPCVTKHEWSQLQKGMTRGEVHNLLDGPGWGFGTVKRHTLGRQYPICGLPVDWNHVVVVYNRRTHRVSLAAWSVNF